MNHLPILPILSFVYKFNNKGQNWKDREYLGGPSYLALILEITQLRKFTWTLKSLLDRLIYHLVIFCAFPLNTHKFDCNSLTGVLLCCSSSVVGLFCSEKLSCFSIIKMFLKNSHKVHNFI